MQLYHGEWDLMNVNLHIIRISSFESLVFFRIPSISTDRIQIPSVRLLENVYNTLNYPEIYSSTVPSQTIKSIQHRLLPTWINTALIRSKANLCFQIKDSQNQRRIDYGYLHSFYLGSHWLQTSCSYSDWAFIQRTPKPTSIESAPDTHRHQVSCQSKIPFPSS
jgi:hypothetical protein